jgi:outer membrane protein assembly factor BamC
VWGAITRGHGFSEMYKVIRSRYLVPIAGALGFLVLLAGCSSINRFVSGDKIDYRSSARMTKALDVPPDLTQLSRDPRFQSQQSGSVSASSFESSASAVAPAAPSGPPITVSAAPATLPTATTTAAAAPADEAHIERAGTQRWMTTRLTPEQLWPQLRTFWQERGFNLVVDEPATGVMETDWAEDRAKLPNDIIRNTLGRLIDSVYSTGERDKFRTRVERTPNGSEVYISHRGLVEIYVGVQRDATMWQPRPTDPQLEAAFLSRLAQKLNTKDDSAKATAAVAKPALETPAAARARLLEGSPGAAMQIDEGFERAWRRVGLALDRTGFTVEDRDRSGGLYYVRYIDPAQAVKEEPGFFGRMFGGSKATQSPSRYRIAVKANGDRTTVQVLDAQGTPESGAVGKRIVALLVEDLK